MTCATLSLGSFDPPFARAARMKSVAITPTASARLRRADEETEWSLNTLRVTSPRVPSMSTTLMCHLNNK